MHIRYMQSVSAIGMLSQGHGGTHTVTPAKLATDLGILDCVYGVKMIS